MPTPRIELLWWPGCPSHPRAKTMLAEALREHGLDPERIEARQVLTLEEARAEAFVGSPTIRISGVDIAPPDDPTPALTCRLYFDRDGRPGPLPDPRDLRDALDRAISTA
ncbi:thioredoxin domain-containing protein [Nocardia macrotermitis]|uniref:Thioredoxin family protein n=1 Tax=Nocardia macrotermitis TaxID=2585198 RepID=A0A7K0D9H9_9NOCA|nr:thioredoxin family protein [Nocardia macrotermitis]MQY22259.1 hypothetical protein [Nocardia macrotermitis]